MQYNIVISITVLQTDLIFSTKGGQLKVTLRDAIFWQFTTDRG